MAREAEEQDSHSVGSQFRITLIIIQVLHTNGGFKRIGEPNFKLYTAYIPAIDPSRLYWSGLPSHDKSFFSM